MTKRIYIAGPMSAYPEDGNYPSFFDAEDKLRDQGWIVENPASFSEWIPNPSERQMEQLIRVDYQALLKCDAIAMLPDWRNSTFAPKELQLAKDVGMQLYDYRCGLLFRMEEETVCAEADRIVMGKRSRDYGHPYINHARIAAFWNCYLGIDLTPEQVAVMMILLKVARQMQTPKRDNLVDICGYAKCVDVIISHEKNTIEKTLQEASTRGEAVFACSNGVSN